MKDNWTREPLGNSVKLQGGYAFSSNLFQESGIPLIRISNISNNGIYKEFAYLPEEKAKFNKEFLLNENDILIAMSGATTGKNCQISKDFLPALLNQRTGRFQVIDNEKIENSYLAFIINSPEFQKLLLVDAIGGAQPNISSRQIESIEVELPPLPQQQKIAKILSTVDEVIEQTESAIAKYQAIKRGLIHDLFTRGIDVNTGKLRPTPQEAPELYKESVLGLIPKEWEVEELEVLCSEKPKYGINAAAVDYNNNLPTYFRITDIDVNGDYSKTGRKSVDNPFSSQYYLKRGDIVFARTGATVGKTYLYNENDGPLVYAGFLIKVSPNINVLDSDFLKFLTETNYYLNWVVVMSQRSGQPGINGAEFGSLKIPTPDIIEQEIISERLLIALKKIQTEQQALAKYQQLKAGLLQDLLTGKVEVLV
ncbi:hypothetical protein BST83_10585 [Polaribacter filamentus]|uniref:Type I restriction modification DNA specificity domain-containing protein n=1 Tax=Polaribacter filamentus TaxID=53483 RepID=A0A2S7KY14_9FLAO|nr:restriction endonuclease subunit S [Polaribacter filamentus]PQB07555.1 hypothetical protein BST83_10585 [Polaribacter filamentus]